MENHPSYRYEYKVYQNDPMNVLEYKLENGLTLLMSINPVEPRIHTQIAVRAGAKQDPHGTTGLAHYMEHMLFKGTDKIGTANWAVEKALLQKISDLYEEHRATSNPESKQKIYSEIDRLSQEAAALAIPNEYDKLATSIGAKMTNAYTAYDQTVFINDIPSNELERWMHLESERFNTMALRLFHTELETVYEEFNISQDRDNRKIGKALRSALYPNHPYGKQTVIGTAYDLKNPSQQNIQNFFSTYYVPNNMALVLVGDFDPDQAVDLTKQYFGHYQPKPIPEFSFNPELPIKAPIRKEVVGQSAAYLDIAWRFKGSQTDDPLMLAFIANLLSNGEVGIFDNLLIQPQKVLNASAWTWTYEDHGALGIYGKPRDGQTLEEVEALLLECIDRLKSGEFDESLLEAIINQFKVQEIMEFESNRGRADTITETYILKVDWQRFIDRYDWFEGLTKEKIQEFAQAHLQDNYVVVYKKEGIDNEVVKVDKPEMTPVKLNRSEQSEFAKAFLDKKVPEITPAFVDYGSVLNKVELENGLSLTTVHNPLNELFRLDFIFDQGKYHDLELQAATLYQEYLGTQNMTKKEVANAFYKIGVTFEFYSKNRHTYITIKGLNEHLKSALILLEEVIRMPNIDERAIEKMVEGVLTKRENAKKDKRYLLRQGLANFGKYGQHTPAKHRLSAESLKSLSATNLSNTISKIFELPHEIYYYGNKSIGEIKNLIDQHHIVPATFRDVKPLTTFPFQDHHEDKVYFLHFPNVQVEVIAFSKGSPTLNFSELLLNRWYNEYFGYGLSSIVFQEIREAMAIAYSTYAFYGTPSFKDQPHFLSFYLGTQPDKLVEAVHRMREIIEHMPVSEQQIENARISILRQIESERLAPKKYFWEYRHLKQLGFRHDVRKDIYQKLKHSHPSDLLYFQEKFVKNRHYHMMLLGDRNRVNLEELQVFGKVEEVSIEDLFGEG